jgi:hypothetical protein
MIFGLGSFSGKNPQIELLQVLLQSLMGGDQQQPEMGMAPSHGQTDPVEMLLMQLLHGMAPRTQTTGEKNREWTRTSGAHSDEDVAWRELAESASKYRKGEKQK